MLFRSRQTFLFSTREFEYHLALLSEDVRVTEKYNPELAAVFEDQLNTLYDLYVTRVKGKR